MGERVLTCDDVAEVLGHVENGEGIGGSLLTRLCDSHEALREQSDRLRAALTQSDATIEALRENTDVWAERAEKAERERDDALAYDAKRLETLHGCIDMVETACDRMGVPRSELGILTWWHRASRAADNFARLERTVERTEAVVFAARVLRRQCDMPVDTYRRDARSFGGEVACELVCRILEAVDALAASSLDHAGAPENSGGEAALDSSLRSQGQEFVDAIAVIGGNYTAKLSRPNRVLVLAGEGETP